MNDLGLVNINELKKQFLNKFACLKKNSIQIHH